MLIHVSNGLVRNIGCDFYFLVSCKAVSKHGITDNDDTVCQIPIVFRTDAKVIFSHQIFHNLFCGCICLIDSGIFVVFEIIGRTFSENICAKTVQRGTGYIKAVCTVFFPVNFEIIIQRFTVIL